MIRPCRGREFDEPGQRQTACHAMAAPVSPIRRLGQEASAMSMALVARKLARVTAGPAGERRTSSRQQIAIPPEEVLDIRDVIEHRGRR